MKEDFQKIGKRLLAPSRETIEHIEPLHPVEGGQEERIHLKIWL